MSATFEGKQVKVLRARGSTVRIEFRDGKQRTVEASRVKLSQDASAPAPATTRIVADDRPRARPVPKMSPPARSEHFMSFVREWACCSCSTPGPSDPHHYGRRGMGQKTDDFRCVPLCRRCHDVFHDTNALPNMDKASTNLFLLQRQVDTLVAYLKHLDNQRREALDNQQARTE